MGDRENAYDSKIAPLMSQIIAVCKEHGIPVVASFELDEDGHGEDDPLMCTTIIVPKGTKSKALLQAEKALLPKRAQYAAIAVHADGSAELVGASDPEYGALAMLHTLLKEPGPIGDNGGEDR